MRKNSEIEISKFCKENNLIPINVRNMKKNNKTRIVITFKCSNCGSRFDISWDNLKHQKYKGLCTKCAHKESQKYRLLEIDDIIKRFTDNGFIVLTPKNEIKGRGNRSAVFTPIDIQNKYGDTYTVSCNNFCNSIEYYKTLSNCDAKNEMVGVKSLLEYKVRQFLIEQNIPFKQEFRFSDCRGKKYPLPFDFCLFYKEDKKILIEVDGEQHFNKGGLFGAKYEDTTKRDRTKDYYCKSNGIPLLRLSYNIINRKDELYKTKILDFIKNNR